MSKLRNHVGTFTLTRELMETEPDAVMAIMGQMIILSTEPVDYFNRIKYTAISFLFDEMPKHSFPAEYELICTLGDRAPALITAERIGVTEDD